MENSLRIDSFATPEVALLLAASGGDAGRQRVASLIGRDLDWAELTRLAVASHATPGLWAAVSRHAGLPPDANRLQALAVVNDFRLFHIRSLVARTTALLRSHGIEVLVLKGAALLVGAVARPTPRTMSDIDLLVTRGSPEDAWRICRANGWKLGNESWTEELYRSHHHLPPLDDPDGVAIGLELHRRLMPGIERLGVDVAALVTRARQVRVRDVVVNVPSPEDLLLHLCLHFAWSNKLRRAAWRTYADAHSIVADPAFDWDRFLALTTSRRTRACSYWTLRLGAAAVDLPAPREVLTRLDPSSGGRFARLLERHFITQIAEDRPGDGPAERAQRRMWFAAMQEDASSADAASLWLDGQLEVPDPSGAAAPPKRGPVRAALTTLAYFTRLVTRG